ncbi:class I SAM-dependent methyltransferase, partial [Megamonas sp.]
NINLPLENISFIHDSHENIDNYIQTKIDIAIFNLGYLPGGDHKFTTKDDTTLKTIDKILNNLNINGYVAIVMYPGHEEGSKEYQSIKLFVKDLPKKSFTVGWYKMINHNFNAPALCWIEKVGEYA